MVEAALAPLAAWQNFYVIIGNPAARDHGIRNAWDLVTYMLLEVPQSQNTSQD